MHSIITEKLRFRRGRTSTYHAYTF